MVPLRSCPGLDAGVLVDQRRRQRASSLPVIQRSTTLSASISRRR